MTTPRPIEHAPIVARLLPGDWALNRIKSDEAADAWHECAYIHDKTKPARQISLMRDWHKRDRLRIVGALPRWLSSGYSPTSKVSIGVSASRPSVEVAREIERRFLPGYLKEWEEAEQYARRQKEVFEDFQFRAQIVRQIFPAMRAKAHFRMTDFPDFHIPEVGELKLQYLGNGSRVTLDLSFSELLKVLHIIKADREQGRAGE